MLRRYDEAIAVLDNALQVARRNPTSAPYDKRIVLAIAGAYNSAGQHDPSSTPPPTPGTSKPTPSPGNVANAAQRVVEMRKDFRACYQRALAKDAELQGSVRLSITVGADGRVTESRGTAFGLPVETVDCVLTRAASTQFDAPVGGKAVIAVPVTFVKE
jgi:hypothetical protein